MAASDQRQRAKAAWRESSAKGFRGPGGRRPGRSAAFLSGALLSLCLVALVGYLLAERPTLQSDSLSQWKLAALRALDVAPGLPRVGYHRSAEIKYLNRTLLLGFLLGLFWFHRRPVALACLFGIGAWVHGALVDLWPEFALQFHLHELSVVETATALGFGLASVLLFLHLLADRRARTGWTLGLLGLFFVCFGEETSWLQHYVRFETPPAIEAINASGRAEPSQSAAHDGFEQPDLHVDLDLPFCGGSLYLLEPVQQGVRRARFLRYL